MKNISNDPAVIEARNLCSDLVTQHAQVTEALDRARALAADVHKDTQDQASATGPRVLERIRRLMASEQLSPAEDVQRLSVRERELLEALRLAREEQARVEAVAGNALWLEHRAEAYKLRRSVLKAGESLIAALEAEEAFAAELTAGGARGVDVSGCAGFVSGQRLDAETLRHSFDRTRVDLERAELLAAPDDGKKQRVRLLVETRLGDVLWPVNSIVELSRKNAGVLLLDRQAEVTKEPLSMRSGSGLRRLQGSNDAEGEVLTW